MLAALLLTVLIHPGDTMSGIAASHGVSLAAVEQANPQVGNPNLIFAGQTLNLPGGSGGTAHSSESFTPSSTTFTPTHHTTFTPVTHHESAPVESSSGGLSDVPGVPSGFAACVAERESSDGANQAYNGGVYGIINASGYHVNGQSISAQKQAFSSLYARYGTAPWAPSDGC
jgi:hypothetical protein